MPRDYYEILDVERGASSENIKRAYRALAKGCHHDTHPGDDKAGARFKEVTAANTVLEDNEKRRQYDEFFEQYGPIGHVVYLISDQYGQEGVDAFLRGAYDRSVLESLIGPEWMTFVHETSRPVAAPGSSGVNLWASSTRRSGAPAGQEDPFDSGRLLRKFNQGPQPARSPEAEQLRTEQSPGGLFDREWFADFTRDRN